MKRRKIDLAIHSSCTGCGKDCNWRANTVAKEVKAIAKPKFGCNTSK